ncbi:hypothetical protein M758_UG234400 [Ceratodon purpureus]|nr:hypothetical protein M758_UG234400 [Ceratodon purpureus]
MASSAMAILPIRVLAMLFLSYPATAFYLPGVAPMDFEEGQCATRLSFRTPQPDWSQAGAESERCHDVLPKR